MESKLHPPANRPGTVPRAKLIRSLLDEPRAPVVAVIGPPGYGKSVLLAEWAAAEDRPVAWLTLDDFDNVPSVFLTYLASAIDRIHPIDGSIRPDIVGDGSRILASVIPRLASELHRFGRPALLVLDDVHRLTDRAGLDALAALMDHLPAGFQIAIAARTPPDLPFARLRAERVLLEVGRADLAMDAAEAAELSAAAGRPLDPEAAERLTERCDGWAAAIYLATIARVRDAPEAIRSLEVSGADGYIADYLRSELIADLPADEVAFLTRTSILETVDPAVAAIITERPDAAARLRALARANQLVRPVSGPGEAYRYHLLLRDFLRAELDAREPGAAPRLHRLVAAWHADQGHRELAIEHAFLGGDMAHAARLVTAALLPTLFGGHGDRLVGWLTPFADADFERFPPLAVVGAWVHLLNGRPAEADHLADIVERASFDEPAGDGSASFASSSAILGGIMARHGPAIALQDARRAVDAEVLGSPWRTLAFLTLGAAELMSGDDDAADRAFADAVEAGAIAGSLVAWAYRSSIAIERGDWVLAGRCARESRHVMERAQLGSIVASLMTYAVSARIALHHGDRQTAAAELVRAQLVRPHASHAAPWFAVGALLELARAYLGLADPAGARHAISEAEAITRRRPALGTLGPEIEAMRERLSRTSDVLVGASTLTTAELRLLPVLSTPLTFKEIGGRLFLSQHTVKTQAISIYGKLGASSRSEAVERAIDLGLLEPFPGLPRKPTPTRS